MSNPGIDMLYFLQILTKEIASKICQVFDAWHSFFPKDITIVPQILAFFTSLTSPATANETFEPESSACVLPRNWNPFLKVSRKLHNLI